MFTGSVKRGERARVQISGTRCRRDVVDGQPSQEALGVLSVRTTCMCTCLAPSPEGTANAASAGTSKQDQVTGNPCRGAAGEVKRSRWGAAEKPRHMQDHARLIIKLQESTTKGSRLVALDCQKVLGFWKGTRGQREEYSCQ